MTAICTCGHPPSCHFRDELQCMYAEGSETWSCGCDLYRSRFVLVGGPRDGAEGTVDGRPVTYLDPIDHYVIAKASEVDVYRYSADDGFGRRQYTWSVRRRRLLRPVD